MEDRNPLTTGRRVLDFMAQKRPALVGVSRNDKSFSRGMLRAFRRQGYDAVAVNPHAQEIEGRRCFRSLREIEPKPDGVILLVSARHAATAAGECAELGIKRLWIPVGTGRVEGDLPQFCEKQGIQLIQGFCPYMFLQNAGFLHRVHGFFATRSRRWRT